MGQCLDKEEKKVGLELKDQRNSSTKKGRRKWRKAKGNKKNNLSRTDTATSPFEIPSSKAGNGSLESSNISLSSAEQAISSSHSSSQHPQANGIGSHMTLNISIQFNGKGPDPRKGLQASHVSVSSAISKSGESAQTTLIHSENDSISLLETPKSPKKALSPLKSPLLRKGMNIFNSPKVQRGPKVLFKSPLNKHLAFRREKNNSTSTLFIKDTLNSPNVDEILRCMAVALLYHIKNGLSASDDKLARVFSERYHPLTKEYVDCINLPDVSTIYRFIKLIFKVQKLPPECAVLCLAYIERILAGNKIVLHPENWRRIVFGSIIIATKVWEDESVWNVDFLDLFPLLTLNDLNNTENKFLELLQFNVLVHGSEYAKYYFELRALSQLDSFPLEPLNKDLQHKLELRSNSYKSFVPPSVLKEKEKDSQAAASVSSASVAQEESTIVAGSVGGPLARLQKPVRCRSMDFFDPKSPPIVIP